MPFHAVWGLCCYAGIIFVWLVLSDAWNIMYRTSQFSSSDFWQQQPTFRADYRVGKKKYVLLFLLLFVSCFLFFIFIFVFLVLLVPFVLLVSWFFLFLVLVLFVLLVFLALVLLSFKVPQSEKMSIQLVFRDSYNNCICIFSMSFDMNHFFRVLFSECFVQIFCFLNFCKVHSVFFWPVSAVQSSWIAISGFMFHSEMIFYFLTFEYRILHPAALLSFFGAPIYLWVVLFFAAMHASRWKLIQCEFGM